LLGSPLCTQTVLSSQAFSDIHQGKPQQVQPAPLKRILDMRVVDRETDAPNAIHRARLD
jgi:hypothetical protein